MTYEPSTDDLMMVDTTVAEIVSDAP